MPLAFILSPVQLCIVAFIVLMLFGNRLPQVMRGLGEGINEFKKGIDSATEPLKELEKESREISRKMKQ